MLHCKLIFAKSQYRVSAKMAIQKLPKCYPAVLYEFQTHSPTVR